MHRRADIVGFEVKGDAQAGYDALVVNIPVIPATASMASPAVGSITYLRSCTVEPLSGTCDFFFSGHEGIGPGKAWLSFTCAGLSFQNETPPTAHPVVESFVAFENCAEM